MPEEGCKHGLWHSLEISFIIKSGSFGNKEHTRRNIKRVCLSNLLTLLIESAYSAYRVCLLCLSSPLSLFIESAYSAYRACFLCLSSVLSLFIEPAFSVYRACFLCSSSLLSNAYQGLQQYSVNSQTAARSTKRATSMDSPADC